MRASFLVDMKQLTTKMQEELHLEIYLEIANQKWLY